MSKIERLRETLEHIGRRLEAKDGEIRQLRANVIEECARVVEGDGWHKDYTADPVVEIAAAIRALKENP